MFIIKYLNWYPFNLSSMSDFTYLLFRREKKQKIQDIKNNIKEAIEVRELNIEINWKLLYRIEGAIIAAK